MGHIYTELPAIPVPNGCYVNWKSRQVSKYYYVNGKRHRHVVGYATLSEDSSQDKLLPAHGKAEGVSNRALSEDNSQDKLFPKHQNQMSTSGDAPSTTGGGSVPAKKGKSENLDPPKNTPSDDAFE